MSEPIVEPTTIDHAAVAAQLQTVNGELRGKNAKHKARIAELEAGMNTKDSELSQLRSIVRQATIDAPMKALAEQVSSAPELFLEQLSKSYKVEMLDGKLTLQTTDGKPVVKGDKRISLESRDLIDLLTDEAHPNHKTFRTIMSASRATGGAGMGAQRRTAESPAPKRMQFGLR